MDKQQKHVSKRFRAERLKHMSGDVVGSVVTKGVDDVAESPKGTQSHGTGVEENTLQIKDTSISALDKAQHVEATGAYLVEKHKNKRAANKRIRSAKRETKRAFNETSLVQKEKSGEPLTESQKDTLKNARKRMERYNKDVKKEQKLINKDRNAESYENIRTKKRHHLEHLDDVRQLTNYGNGDGQGTGIEENLQDNMKGTVTWAGKRTFGAVKDLKENVGSHLEHKRAAKMKDQKPQQDQKAKTKENLKSKHTKRTSKRSLSGVEEKTLTKEEKRHLQKKRLQKRINKIRFKNDKLSGIATKIKEIAKSKGTAAAVLGIAGPILIIFGVIIILFMIFASIGGVSGEMHEYTSYQAEDETLLLSNKEVVDEEKKDRKDIQDTEVNHPTASDGLPFNEYQYALNGTLMSKDALIARIKHDGNLIASYMTAKYGDYTLDDAKKQELKQIYEEAFKLDQYEEIQARTSTFYDTVTSTTYYWNGSSWQAAACTYRYAIFHTDLTETPLDDVLKAHLATEEQERFYELYKSTSGQKDYLFGGYTARDDIYRYQYDPEEYKAIYGEADISFSDAEAQQIYNVASTQLGRPYHWGGSSLSTGFDCSGYVYWVMNTSGVATFPRTSANVMLQTFCDPISPAQAKPGDLIFFQGTYATVGASHVGIYLGNNQMIHCGDPIKITNISTNYWTTHFYTYGRIKDDFR